MEKSKSITNRVPTETHVRLEAERFWDELEVAYDQLDADPAAAASYEAETTAWDATLLDGLENDPWLE